MKKKEDINKKQIAFEFFQTPEGAMMLEIMAAKAVDRVTQNTIGFIQGAHDRIDELEKFLLEKFPNEGA